MKYYLLIIISLVFFSCEEPVAVEDDIGTGTQLPETIIDAMETFTSSSITLDWDGNEYTISYRYKLIPLDYLDTVQTYLQWTDWDTTSMVSFINLDDGLYDFYIQGRFTSDIEEIARIIPIEVDAIPGPAIRAYPLLRQASHGEQVNVYIYAENVESVAFTELNLSYNPSLLTYNGVARGELLLNSPIYLDLANSSDGTISISAVADDFTSYVGTGSIAILSFTTSNLSGTATITINASSVLIRPDNSQINLPDNIHGKIEIE